MCCRHNADKAISLLLELLRELQIGNSVACAERCSDCLGVGGNSESVATCSSVESGSIASIHSTTGASSGQVAVHSHRMHSCDQPGCRPSDTSLPTVRHVAPALVGTGESDGTSASSVGLPIAVDNFPVRGKNYEKNRRKRAARRRILARLQGAESDKADVKSVSSWSSYISDEARKELADSRVKRLLVDNAVAVKKGQAYLSTRYDDVGELRRIQEVSKANRAIGLPLSDDAKTYAQVLSGRVMGIDSPHVKPVLSRKKMNEVCKRELTDKKNHDKIESVLSFLERRGLLQVK